MEANGCKMIICENLIKIYKTSEIEVVALQGLDLEVDKGEVIAVIGNSGSGKSTLLNILGGLDKPTAGNVLVDGKDLLKLNDKQLMKYKRETVGFVWQNNARNLIPYLTALENIELPMLLNGKRKKWMAEELLDMVGLSARKKNRLRELSGGEQQRVAIAIAVSNYPSLILADEPTGAVDTGTTNQIMQVFNDLNKVTGVTIVIVTHDRQISKKVNRVVAIRDGRTSSELIRKRSYRIELEDIKEGMISNTYPDEDDPEDEYAVLDKAGRIHIPKDYLDKLKISSNKLKVGEEQGRIILSPPDRE